MISWNNERRKLRDLVPWGNNPRQIKNAQAERLLESFTQFGQVLPICIGPDDEIYDGHQRRSVIGAADEYGLDFEVDVRVSSRSLTEHERQKLTVYLHKGAAGEWDFDELANSFDMDDLLEWGFEPFELGLQPSDGEWGDSFNLLPDGDRSPFQQMTFTLHDEQVEKVKSAISAVDADFTDSTNQNSNGNALAYICGEFLDAVS